MKFLLVEDIYESSNLYSTIYSKIMPEFLSQSKKFIVNTPQERCFIDTDGNFISEGDRCSHFGIIEDICFQCDGFPERYLPDGIQQDDQDYPLTSPIVDTIQDYVSEEVGWIQCSYDNSSVLIYKKPTEKQYIALEDYINYISTLNSKFYFYVKSAVKKYSLVENTPAVIIKKIKKYFISGVLEEDILSESLQSLGDDMFITDSAYTIRDLLLNKPKAYRLLYDANIDMYMICDANRYIHEQMMERAVNQGYYVNATHSDPVVQGYIDDMNKHGETYNYEQLGIDGYYTDYSEDDSGKLVEFPSYLLYMIYVPADIDEKEVSNSPSSDGYDDETKYSFGTLYTRNAYMPDFFDSCDLLKVLERANTNRKREIK